jgi:transposase
MEKLSREELIYLLLQQAEQLQALLKRIKELERKNARSAAPFSKNKNKLNPKKAGRKKGKGKFTNRQSPQEEDMDEIIDVEVSMTQCGCGGELEDTEEELVSKTDLPPAPKVEIKGYRIKTKRCKTCGKKYRGKHADVADDQYGATAHRMGERIISMAHVLHYEDGIPQRKVPGVLLKLMGIKLTQGLLAQDAMNQGGASGNVGRASESIREGIKHSEQVHTDDTGWRTGGTGTFLMGFETPESVFFQIRPQHRNEEVREVVPSDYEGVMITDRGKSYDAKVMPDVRPSDSS